MFLTSRSKSPGPESGQRRRVARVKAELTVAVARADGQKFPARVIDVSVGGMHLASASVPNYGEDLTVVVRLDESDDWVLLPAVVRWFTSSGFGIAFESLDEAQARALTAFVDRVAA